MQVPETKQSDTGEVSSHEQVGENDAQALQNLGYKQQLNVRAGMKIFALSEPVANIRRNTDESQRTFGFVSSLGLTTTVMATCK